MISHRIGKRIGKKLKIFIQHLFVRCVLPMDAPEVSEDPKQPQRKQATRLKKKQDQEKAKAMKVVQEEESSPSKRNTTIKEIKRDENN